MIWAAVSSDTLIAARVETCFSQNSACSCLAVIAATHVAVVPLMEAQNAFMKAATGGRISFLIWFMASWII